MKCTPVPSSNTPKKKKSVKIIYDALNIPRHGLRSLLRNPFSPTARLLINAVHPGVACGNLIHYYYECSLSVFILYYIMNPFIFLRLSYFYKSNFIISAYYFHLFRVLSHGIIDIPLCLFQCRIKNANSRKLTIWRGTYVCYSFLILMLCSMLFHIFAFDGPQLTFTQYRRIVFFINDHAAYTKINEYVQSDAGNLYHGIIYILILTFVIDALYICWFIFNAASFKRFKRDNAMLYFVRYCAAFIRVLTYEFVLGILVWMIKSEQDPSVWDIVYGLLSQNRAAFI